MVAMGGVFCYGGGNCKIKGLKSLFFFSVGGWGEKIVGIEIAAAALWVIWGNVWWLSVCWRHGQLFKQFERFL
jgi:hypothetical protein